MALTVIVENGQGLTNSNSYVTVAEATAYFEGRLYSTTWTSAGATLQAQAVVMAARMIDSEIQFNGFKLNAAQALQWPRVECPDPDISDDVFSGSAVGPFILSDIVPKPVKDASCELALKLLQGDRTVDSGGGAGGIREVEISGAIRVAFVDGINPLPAIPDQVANMLWKYGREISNKSGTVKLSRV